MSGNGSLPDGTAAGIARTRDSLHRARHLPGHVYTSPEIYRLEKERIFMRDWLCVGRMEEVAEPRRLHGAEDHGRADRRRARRRRPGQRLRQCLQAPRRRGRQRFGQHEGVQLPLPRLALRSPGQADRRPLHEGGRGLRSRELPADAAAPRRMARLDVRQFRCATPRRSPNSPPSTKGSSPSSATRRCGWRPSTSSVSTATGSCSWRTCRTSITSRSCTGTPSAAISTSTSSSST